MGDHKGGAGRVSAGRAAGVPTGNALRAAMGIPPTAPANQAAPTAPRVANTNPSVYYTGVARQQHVQDMYLQANGGRSPFGNFAYIGAHDFRSAHRRDDGKPDTSSVRGTGNAQSIDYQTGLDFKTGWKSTRMNIALDASDTYTVRLYTTSLKRGSRVRNSVSDVYADNLGSVMVDMYNGFVRGQRG